MRCRRMKEEKSGRSGRKKLGNGNVIEWLMRRGANSPPPALGLSEPKTILRPRALFPSPPVG